GGPAGQAGAGPTMFADGGEVPVPHTCTSICGRAGSFVVKRTVPVRWPGSVGSKVTVKMVEEPGAMDCGAAGAMAVKSALPVLTTPVICSDCEPAGAVFDTLMLIGALPE